MENYIYCYLDNIKNLLKFDNITSIEYLNFSENDSMYKHMKDTKLQFINNHKIKQLVILDNNVILHL